ncbi:hypothetical protein GCM10010964_24690 [Caldovatus sediminis]|uniref:Iron transporter n=1 Tax=Caldovatus sediminis TaxID=2041189 RepID=A0A8J2ZC75_9PROT|nr:VIT1/CCC1 transporter family protein [Caldovatus sediminis]GGG35851.1 hypothetical protein GCM10010964_24690 [Caldovatus sediminis]
MVRHESADAPPAAVEPAALRDGLPPMPGGPPHEETHFAAGQTVRDLAIGAADGVIVPFALAAGLAGVAASNRLIATAGLAATAAGCVAIGLGRYLAARTEADHYATERRREEKETHLYPDREKWEVAAILHRYGVKGEVLHQAVDAIAAERRKWVDFMMRFELDLTEPEPGRAARAATAAGAACAAGGLVPLLPYMVLAETRPALLASCAVAGAALLGFGWLKAKATGMPALRGAVQTLLIGGLAAAAAFVVAQAAGG